MLKILIVDDHPLIRKGLKQILTEYSLIGNVQEAKDGQDAMEIVRKEKLDAVILDISLPDRDGLDILKDIKYENPDLPVIIFSLQPESLYAPRAFKCGASACLNKSVPPEELLEAIKTVVQGRGRHYINQKVSDILLNNLKNDGSLPHTQLSDREFQIMTLIASGKRVGEISDELCLSVKTVSTYRTRLLKKLNLKNNSQITRYSIEQGLL